MIEIFNNTTNQVLMWNLLYSTPHAVLFSVFSIVIYFISTESNDKTPFKIVGFPITLLALTLIIRLPLIAYDSFHERQIIKENKYLTVSGMPKIDKGERTLSVLTVNGVHFSIVNSPRNVTLSIQDLENSKMIVVDYLEVPKQQFQKMLRAYAKK
jgi:hypothetical protein